VVDTGTSGGVETGPSPVSHHDHERARGRSTPRADFLEEIFRRA
jgi:hypothetical protein